MKECELEIGSKEYMNLQLFARMLTSLSTQNTAYIVQDTYLDYGQGWRWTTVIAYKDDGQWQAITPKEWENITAAKSVVEIAQLAEEHFKGRFALDTMREF